MLSIRHGFFHSEHIDIDFVSIGNKYGPKYDCNKEKQHCKIEKDLLTEIEHKVSNALSILGTTGKNSPLFINGRNLHGISSGWIDSPRWDKTRIWTENGITNYESEVKLFIRILELLSSRFTIYYFTFTSTKKYHYDKLKNEFLIDTNHPHETNLTNLKTDNLSTKETLLNLLIDNDIDNNKINKSKWSTHKINSYYSPKSTNNDSREKIYKAFKYIDQYKTPHIKNINEILYKVLYAITLFRESRNKACLYSSAIYLGPHFFSRKGIYLNTKSMTKNNTDLKKVVEKFIEKLISIDLLHTKHGGFLWMEFSERTIIQKILEDKKVMGEKTYFKNKKNPSLINFSSTIHYEISEWYTNAFFSTNHADPLISAIYHKIRTINTIRNFIYSHPKPTKKPINLTNEDPKHIDIKSKLLLAISTINSLSKLFMESKNSLRFWMSNVRVQSQLSPKSIIYGLNGGNINGTTLDNINLDEQIDQLLDGIIRKEDYEKHKIAIESLKKSYHYLIDQIFRLNLDISNESYNTSNNRKKNKAIRGDGGQQTTQNPPSEEHIELVYRYKDISINQVITIRDSSSIFIKSYENEKNWSSNLYKIINKNKLSESLCRNIPKEAPDNSFIHSNHYKFRESSGKNRIDLVRDEKIYNLLVNQDLSRDLLINLNRLSDLCFTLADRARLYARLIDLTSYRIEKFRKQNREKATNKEIKKKIKIIGKKNSLWRTALDISIYALELTRHIHPLLLNYEHPLKIKLLAFRGLALAKNQQFSAAHSVLNQASALTFNLPLRDNQTLQAIINLRRAEVYLEESKILKSALINLYNSINHKNDNPDNLEFVVLKLKEVFNFNFLEDFNEVNEQGYHLRVLAINNINIYNLLHNKIERCNSLLDSAESLLSGHSHSPIWWSRFYVLKLSVLCTYFVPEPKYITKYNGKVSSYLQSELIQPPLLLPPAFRLQATDPNHLLTLFRKSLSVAGESNFQKLIFCNLYFKALKTIHRYFLIENHCFGKAFKYPKIMQESINAINNYQDKQHSSEKWDKVLPDLEEHSIDFRSRLIEVLTNECTKLELFS